MKKKERPLFGGNEEVSKNCSTCKYARPLDASEDFVCSKKGVVSRKFVCRAYQLNLLLKQPPKKRFLDTSRYKPEDFSID